MKWKKSDFEQNPFYNELLQNGYSKLEAITLVKNGCSKMSDVDSVLRNRTHIDPTNIDHIFELEEVLFSHIGDEVICVFGDYDADGITSSAILYSTLSELGFNVSVRLPEREEGYGISMKAIDEQLSKGVKLFITVDNGIRAIDEIAYARQQGADVIVLDHHEPGEQLPNATVLIDSKCSDQNYPDKHLTGAGLAYMVSIFLMQRENNVGLAYKLADLAAIGTIADVETLTGENRLIVKDGLELMHSPFYNRPIIQLLYEDLKHITAEDIAFSIAPKINAAGRLSSPVLAFNALIENSQAEAIKMSTSLNKLNETRKKFQKECVDEISTEVRDKVNKGNKIIVALSEKATTGVVGLLAGNIKEEYYLPTIVFGKKEQPDGTIEFTASARSIDTYNLIEHLDKAQEQLHCFKAYGGHKLAAGMTVNSIDDIERLSNFLNSTCKLTKDDIEKCMEYDLEISEKELTSEIFNALSSQEPFGVGFRKPIIKVTDCQLISKNSKLYDTMGTLGTHLKLFCEEFSIMGFNFVEKYVTDGKPRKINCYCTLNQNYFSGIPYNQLSMIDYSFVPVKIPNLRQQLISSLTI